MKFAELVVFVELLMNASSPEDLLEVARKYIPRSVIVEAAKFSWKVQHYEIPDDLDVTEDFKFCLSHRRLAELVWNTSTEEWLHNKSEELALLANLDSATVLIRLAKALAIAVVHEPTPDDEEFQGWE